MSSAAPTATGLPSGRLGMWLFLSSEVMLFGAFISAFIVMRLGSPNFGVPDLAIMGRPLATVNTFILMLSSLTMSLALSAIRREDRRLFSRYVRGTILLGVIFLGVKGYEYHHKIAEGLTMTSSLFGSFYFTLTGLHALHMIAGLIFNGYVLAHAATYTRDHHARVEYAGLYWHFVDMVWMVLFPMFYLLP